MSKTIQIKRSSTQGAIPLTSNLVLGELALNTFDGKLYSKKNDGTESIIEIGGSTGSAINIQESTTTATNNQTVFVVSGKVCAITELEVFENQLRIRKADYSVSDDGTDTTVTFSVGRSTGDIIDIVTYK